MSYMFFKGPNIQNVISFANSQATMGNEIETMVLLVTVHTACDKNIASSFYSDFLVTLNE